MTDGKILNLILGIAGAACSAHLPITSSILTSMYPTPSTRRYRVFTFFLAGGNAFAMVFGSLGSGLVKSAFGRTWYAPFVFIAVVYAIVTIAAWLTVPNLPQNYPHGIVASRSEDRYILLGDEVENLNSATN